MKESRGSKYLVRTKSFRINPYGIAAGIGLFLSLGLFCDANILYSEGPAPRSVFERAFGSTTFGYNSSSAQTLASIFLAGASIVVPHLLERLNSRRRQHSNDTNA